MRASMHFIVIERRTRATRRGVLALDLAAASAGASGTASVSYRFQLDVSFANARVSPGAIDPTT